jgi:uncharacterized membrane protein
MGIHAIPMMITCILQGTLCDTGIPCTFYGENICSAVYLVIILMALVKKNSIQCTIDKVYVWAIQFHEFQSTFLHIKAHLLHFLRKDLKYHHKEKNEIKTDLKIIVFCKLNE